MPVKRRTNKRRVDAEREYFVWSAIFDIGDDLFRELESIGVPVGWTEAVPPELAREPWTRFGERWLAEHANEARLHPVWALELFGQPWENEGR